MTEALWNRINSELTQAYSLRKEHIKRISKHFENRYIVSHYIRFRANARLDDGDVEMLRTLLTEAKMTKDRKILFITHSPGGDPLAAEKIIKLLSEFSSNDYWILVPSVAKSAATMIALGASKIILNPTSELGPIDLQVFQEGKGLIPAYSIIAAYERLMVEGVNLKGSQRIEPILQQLQAFDASQIEYFRQVNDLAADIAVKVLKKCMMKKASIAQIKKVINIFLDPTKSKLHGRPIYGSDIAEVDKNKLFNIECVSSTDSIWQTIAEYHLRVISHMRATEAAKLIESEAVSLHAN